MWVYMCVCLYMCVFVCVCMFVLVCVCLYGFVFLFDHSYNRTWIERQYIICVYIGLYVCVYMHFFSVCIWCCLVIADVLLLLC